MRLKFSRHLLFLPLALSGLILGFQNCSGPPSENSVNASNPAFAIDSQSTAALSTGNSATVNPETSELHKVDHIIQIGTIDGKSTEFKNGNSLPWINDPNISAADFINWIGFSNCSTCPQSPRIQSLKWTGLEVGNVYEIDVYPGEVITPPTIQDPNVPMSMNFEVMVDAGAVDFLDGSNVRAMNPVNKPVWKIRFIARTNVVQLSIGTQEPSSVNYMYVDAYEFLELGPFIAPSLKGRFLTFAHMYQGPDNFYMMHGVAQLLENNRAIVNFYFVDVNEARPRYAQAPGIPFTFVCSPSVPFMYKPPFTKYYQAYKTTWTQTGLNSFDLNLLDVGFSYSTDMDDRVRLNVKSLVNAAGYGFLGDTDPLQMTSVDYRQIPNHTEYVGSASDYFLNRSLRHVGMGYNPAYFALSDNFAANTSCPGLQVYAYNQPNEMGKNLNYFQGGGHSYWTYSIKNKNGIVDRTIIIENSTKSSEPGKYYIGISRARAL